MALAAGSVRALLAIAPDALPRSREIHADPGSSRLDLFCRWPPEYCAESYRLARIAGESE